MPSGIPHAAGAMDAGALDSELEAVLETAFDAVCVMNPDGILVGWNDRATDTFGWTRDEALGTRLSEMIIPPELRAAHEQGLRRFLATGEESILNRTVELNALHRDGYEFPVELSITNTRQLGHMLFVGFIRDISERKERAERQQRRLQESDHRVKNMLTVVSAIAHQTARTSESLEAFTEAFNGRLQALARSHSLLAGKEWQQVALSALVEQVLGGDVAQGRASFGGPEILIAPARVLGLSMILHELYTNAIKYGALCTDQGTITLEWERKGEMVEMVWTESGPPCTAEHMSTGFGQRMIAMAVKSDLNGTIERDWRPEGLSATLAFPID